MNARKLTLVVPLALMALTLVAASAQAAVVHEYLPKPSEEIAKKAPAGSIAVAADSGELYVLGTLGTKDNSLVKFNASSGAFLSQFPNLPEQTETTPGFSYAEKVAVAHSTGEVYVVTEALPPLDERSAQDEGVVAALNAAGSLQATWKDANGPEGVAVDNSPNLETQGDVYVTSPQHNVVYVFKPGGVGGSEETTPIAEIPVEHPEAVAVDEANGNVIVGGQEGLEGRSNVASIFKPTVLGGYELLHKITGTPGRAFADKVTGIAAAGGEGDGDIYISISGSGPNNKGEDVVDQFSSEGVFQGQLTGISQAQPFSEPMSVAVDPSSGDVFVDDYGYGAVDVFGPSFVIPDVVTGPATNVTPVSATLTGTVKLDGEGEATCQFAWGTTPAFGETPVPCSAPAMVEESPVQATLSQASHSALQPDTTYYYRLQAANKKNGVLNPGGPQEPQPECEGKPAVISCFKTPGPGIHSESSSEVASRSATLQASIDPDGVATSYYFQYSTSSTVGCKPSTCTAVPGESGVTIGSGSGDVPLEQQVEGLSAGTVYHYRVVAVSEVPVEVAPGTIETKLESFYGPDRTITTQGAGAFALPDGRQWEMASPPDLHGAKIEALDTPREYQGGPVQAAAGGGAIAYMLAEPQETEIRGFAEFAQARSTRGAEGWSSRELAIPIDPSVPLGIQFSGKQAFGLFSEDLSQAVVQPLGPFVALSPEASEQTAYLADLQSGEYTPLVTGCPAEGEPCAPSVEEHADVPPGTVFAAGECKASPCGPQLVGATPDLHHVLLTYGPSGSEWSAGEPPSEALQPLRAIPGPLYPLDHQLSDGGSVFFDSVGHLFLQDVARREVVRLDVAQGVSEPGEGHAEFLYASSDGSTVLFSDSDQLTSAAGGGVYECRVAEVEGGLACAQLALTGLAPTGPLIGGSEDASYLYFEGGVDTLYVDHREGSGWKQTAIATLSPGDGSTAWNDVSNGKPDLTARMSRVSPNGEWFAFMSQRSLTGYDNRDAVSGAPDEEVYLYSARSGRLVCASCNPTGARPHGVEYEQLGSAIHESLVGGYGEWSTNTWLAANVPAWTLANGLFYQPRYLSDGGRLFFNSSDALVPKDVNDQEDVYEYEPEGVPAGEHTCSPAGSGGSVVFRPAHAFDVEGRQGEEGAGCIALISSGTSAEESALLDVSENGGDVFFLTASHLVAQVSERGIAIYDAHECTSASPCFAETASPPACVTVEGCRAAPEPQPAAFGVPSSATFSGAGNVTPPAAVAVKAKSNAKVCRKGFAKRKGVCVRSKVKKKGKGKRGGGARRSRVGAPGERGRGRS